MSKRDDTPVDLPDAMIAYRLGDLNNHPAYEEAKAGSMAAAFLVADSLITPELVAQFTQYFNLISETSVTLLPVLAEESQGRNKIPAAVAIRIEEETGLLVESNIVQASKVGRTGLSGLDRVFTMPEFQGEVQINTAYLLLDDTLTQGGTLAALASHIRQGGGQVVGAFALTGKQYSAKLRLDPVTLQQLRDKHGDIEHDFRTATGYGFPALTQSEARTLTNFRPAESVRNRIFAARDEKGDG
jgi:hypothetical protein